MSNSYRKHPWMGLCSHSDKPFKVTEHRRERRKIRALLPILLDDSDGKLHHKPFGDPWSAPKDGKCRVIGPEDMRK